MAQLVDHLEEAPIREAIIDLRVAPKLPDCSERLKGACEQLAEEFPTQRPLSQHEIGLHVDAEQPPKASVDRHHRGYRLESEEGDLVLQLRNDGFTLSKLKPYYRWEELRDKALHYWGIYCEFGRPEKVVRTAVRYINVLRIPLPIEDFSDYLTCPPAVPDELPQKLDYFLTRMRFPKESIPARCILTQALEGSDGNFASIILDVDAFNEEEHDPSGQGIWDKLESLRDFKNTAFYSSITERTVELYK